jgi:hypothetical protein
MKYLIILLLLLTGCGSNDEMGQKYVETTIKLSNYNLDKMEEACIELGKCMGGHYNVIHFPGQTSAPYVCEIKVDKDRSWYFYPDASLMFGSLDIQYFKNAITACGMIKKSGEFSDKHIAEVREIFRKMEEDRVKREEAKNAPKPKPQIEVKEYK